MPGWLYSSPPGVIGIFLSFSGRVRVECTVGRTFLCCVRVFGGRFGLLMVVLPILSFTTDSNCERYGIPRMRSEGAALGFSLLYVPTATCLVRCSDTAV